jgi:hypothetical protein
MLAQFTVVVQPALSLYVSPQSLPVNGSLSFNGLLFACIPCLTDQVIVEFTRPDGTNVSVKLPLVATGGPYPGGYYQGNYTLDMAGQWRVQAIWEGNNVTLPVASQVEEISVGSARASLAEYEVIIVLLAIVVVSVSSFVWKMKSREKRKKVG